MNVNLMLSRPINKELQDRAVIGVTFEWLMANRVSADPPHRIGGPGCELCGDTHWVKCSSANGGMMECPRCTDPGIWVNWNGYRWQVDGFSAGTGIVPERPVVQHDCGHEAVAAKATAIEQKRCQELALEEFAYWRELCDSTDDAILSHIAMGAGCAAANLLGSIMGLLSGNKRKGKKLCSTDVTS